MRLFKKILKTVEYIPFPGDLKNIIKTSLAFSNKDDEHDYLRKIYESFDLKNRSSDLKSFHNKGFTVREIELLTGVSKSKVSREINI